MAQSTLETTLKESPHVIIPVNEEYRGLVKRILDYDYYLRIIASGGQIRQESSTITKLELTEVEVLTDEGYTPYEKESLIIYFKGYVEQEISGKRIIFRRKKEEIPKRFDFVIFEEMDSQTIIPLDENNNPTHHAPQAAWRYEGRLPLQ